MFRVLFLILTLMSSFVFAQTEEKPQAIKFDEFETTTNGDVKARMDNYFNELNNNPTTIGYIINYGTAKEIAKREKQIRDSIRFRKYDGSRITLVNGGYNKIIVTQFWVVPAGAEYPKLEPTARKFTEVGKVPDGTIKSQVDSFFIELNNNPTAEGYIITYGSSREIAIREKKINQSIQFRKYDNSRIIFVRGGYRKEIKTEFWVIPNGAEPPTP